MSDTINAKGSDSKFRPHPDGQYIGICVDTIDLGDNVETFAGQPSKLAHKCALVFRTGERNEETGDYIDIGREFTVSMGEKANLRKFLEQWRGKAYDAEQIEAGVPLHKLTNQAGLLTIAQETSKQGRKYAKITACVGVPKQMKGGIGQYTDYTRADYWDEKKAAYLAAARQFRAEQAPTSTDDDEAPPYEDSEMPF
ncbi:MAG: hypothetical protein V4529_16820 [Gemmatimonadota bacterium]